MAHIIARQALPPRTRRVKTVMEQELQDCLLILTVCAQIHSFPFLIFLAVKFETNSYGNMAENAFDVSQNADSCYSYLNSICCFFYLKQEPEMPHCTKPHKSQEKL